MTWMCDKLQLADPKIDPTPEAGEIESIADTYLEHLIERWKNPLSVVPAEKFEDQLYTAPLGS